MRFDLFDVLGMDYVFEHILGEHTKYRYEMYKSEMQRAEVNAIFKVLGGDEMPFPMSWEAIRNYKPEKRTPEEITDHIMTKLHGLGEKE